MSSAPRVKPRIVSAKKAPVSSPFTNIQKKENVLKFTLAPTHVSYANTIRRAALTLVESVGFNADIEEGTGATTHVKILKNNTPLSNEMLAHRIGLLPIHVESPLTWKSDDYVFKISIKNESQDPKDVTADEIEVYKGEDRVPSKNFFHPNRITGSTALLTVLKGKSGTAAPEALECEMRATVGIGKQNARFIPLSQCSYKYTLDPDEKRQKEVFLTWLNDSKKVSASDLETNENRKGELQREFATMELNRCYLEENNEPYSFDFTLESIGVLTPEYILGRALEILQAKCSRYASINVGDLPENLKVTPADARMQGYDFLFVGEDHTLGNLFQTYIEQNLMTEEGDVSFVGYKVPHPLRDEMLLRVGVEKDGQQVTARAAVAAAAKGCADLFAGWRAAWGAMS